jgi:hypothetical protein
MSETIDYWGKITGFRKDEKNEIENVCRDFQDADMDNLTDTEIQFRVDGGWRGGGTCEDLVKEHFKNLATKKPHIKIEVYCTYVEHSPVEVITLENDKISSYMNDW